MVNQNIKEKWIDTGRGKIYYYQNLSFDHRPTVVFLHGLSSNHTTWLNIMNALEECQYNCLALDMRGHGLSDKSKIKSLYELAVFSDDIKKIIEIENIRKFILVGYSFGGTIALDYATRNKADLAGLIIISAGYTNPFKYRKLNFLKPLFTVLLNFLAFILIWQKRKKYYYYIHGASNGYWNSVWKGLITMPLSVNFWMLIQASSANFKKNLSRITVPALIVRGKKDPFLTRAEAEDMIKIMPDAKLIISDNPSHFVASHAQREVCEIIINFLRSNKNLHNKQ